MTHLKYAFSCSFVALFLAHGACSLSAEGIPSYTIVIDPGHGGAVTRKKDDKWDPVTERYLDYYSTGMEYRKITEESVVLPLGKRVRDYIELTATEEGWLKFTEILKQFSNQKEFPRIIFKAAMSREDSWTDRSTDPNQPELNAPYRHYDYPDENGKMQPGRISTINALHPYLVVSLHMNPAGYGHPGGMAAVIAPGFKTFEELRQITLGKKPVKQFYKLKWWRDWLIAEPGWSKYESARADTWVYFHGYRTVKNAMRPWREKNRGIRHNMIQWRYRDPDDWVEKAKKNEPGPYTTDYEKFKPEGKFWDRERSQPEEWRREDGILEIGGDNHYASDELLRFIQYGVRLQSKAEGKQFSPGPIRPPYISTYGLPTFLNAINAYLEVGYLNRTRDRNLIMKHTDQVAQSIAVGIYSLFSGLKLKPGYGPYRPRAKPLDFQKYENYSEGNYFTIVTE